MYCKAQLMTGGLGNRLLPWARCSIFSEVNQAKMLAPGWINFSLGPILRRETDSRIYMGLFQKAPEEISYFKGLCLSPFLQVRAEPKLLDARVTDANPRSLFLFSGHGDFF